jgi:hypothetical protein
MDRSLGEEAAKDLEDPALLELVDTGRFALQFEIVLRFASRPTVTGVP